MTLIMKAPYPDSEYTLYLPSPTLNNVQRLTLAQDIKRNLNQEIITYIKRNTHKQFTWQILMSVAKRWECYYFLREYCEQKMQIVDHHDRVLVGYLINGAHTFTHERRANFPSTIYNDLVDGDQITEELVSISFDFVGDFL